MITGQLEGVPLYFGASERSLFGWYHAGAGPQIRSCAVLLVSPLGVDHTRSHRSYRHLALRLSRAGFPVLRFDLHGTGDSADGSDSASGKNWMSDIDAAVSELRRQSGVADVSFVGLRMGGTLAMTQAAARGDVKSLVLWGPCPSGSAYVKEVLRMHKMYAMLEPQRYAEGAPLEGGKEALGFFLSSELTDALSKIDLATVTQKPAPRALVIHTENSPAKGGLAERLPALGVETTVKHMPGHKFLIQTPRQALIPDEILNAIVGWLSEQHPFAGDAKAGTPLPPLSLRTMQTRDPADPGAAATLTEEWLKFGRHHALFGILTSPRADAPKDLPGIIFSNAGCINRCGAQRNHVTLARRWAQLGFPVLRFDLSGLGDSETADGAEENSVFPPSGGSDIREAMDRLSAECQVSRFIVVGLCSGGDFAFKVAIDEPRVVGAVLMNPRTFLVSSNEMVEAYLSARYYQGSMFEKEKWLKLARGEVDLSQVVGKVLPKVKDVLSRRVAGMFAPLLDRVRGSSEGQSRPQNVPDSLRGMVKRGVDTLLVVSEHDPGIEYVDAHFRDQMRELNSLKGYRREDVKGADHSFTSVWSQVYVQDLITDHLSRRYLSARPTR